jgi:8-oxo-dGTP pyrophosphatase MutT (NUDIX family)
MYKVFVNDLPIILSTKKNIGKQYTTIPLKEVKFKKLIRKINDGSLLYVNLYHKNEEKLEQFLLKKLPVVFAGGGLVFNAKKEILFIRRNGKWDLPKGKVEKDESYQAAALRETQEETGVQDLELRKFIAKTYHVFKRNGRYKLKQTYWFEMHSNFEGNLEGQAEEGIEKVEWVHPDDIDKVLDNSYENIKLLFEKTKLDAV